MYYVYQKIEVIEHLDMARVDNLKLIKADSTKDALIYIARNNKFQSNSRGLIEFLDGLYHSIIEKMPDDDLMLEMLEKQKGLKYWLASFSQQCLMAEPTISALDILNKGIEINAIGESHLYKFVHKSYKSSVTYRLSEMELTNITI